MIFYLVQVKSLTLQYNYNFLVIKKLKFLHFCLTNRVINILTYLDTLKKIFQCISLKKLQKFWFIVVS